MKKRLKEFKSLVKIHSKKYLKTNILFLSFVITSVINSLLLRAYTVNNLTQIEPLLADFAIVLIVGAFGYLIKPKHQFKYYITWSIIFVLICIVNSVYYNNYLSFTSFSLLKTSAFIFSMSNAVIDNVMEYKDITFVWQIIALIFVNRSLKKRAYYNKVAKIEKGKVRTANTLVVALLTLGIFISTLTSIDVGRLYKQWNREYLVQKFGIYLYQFDDLFVTVISGLNPLFGYDDANLKFNEFFDNKEVVTEDNEYTNIFEGKNVIAIHAESIQNYFIGLEINGKEVTPTLNKLSKEGLYFSNFHSQESVGTSSDTEFTTLTGLLPSSSGTTFVNYYDRNYDSTLKQLKEKGYYTFSMHGNNGTFWNRISAYKYLGYDKFYYYNDSYDIDEVIGLGLSDKSFFRQSSVIIDDIASTYNNFYGTVIMLSNHTPFTNGGEPISDFDVTLNYEVIDPETGITTISNAPYLEGTTLGNYIKAVNYADEALSEFITELDETGVLDNTVIVIYGDHDSKLKKSEYKRMYNYNPQTDSLISSEDPAYVDIDYYWYELNREVPLIIWAKDNQIQKEVDKPMGMYDMAPTLANMLNIDLEYSIGHDIFSVDENVVVFPSGNWLSDKMYYSQSKNEGYLLDENSTVSLDYINEYNELATTYLSVSNSIIVYDLLKDKEEKLIEQVIE